MPIADIEQKIEDDYRCVPIPEHVVTALHSAALSYEAGLRAGEDVEPADVASANIRSWVGDTGLEPMTSSV